MHDHLLNVGGTEWVIIIFVALVLILGTGKLPGAARKIGMAVNEYNKAKNDLQEHVKNVQDNVPKISGPVESERIKLETIARSIGVNVEDKSEDELRSIIAKKIGGSSTASTTTKDGGTRINATDDTAKKQDPQIEAVSKDDTQTINHKE